MIQRRWRIAIISGLSSLALLLGIVAAVMRFYGVAGIWQPTIPSPIGDDATTAKIVRPTTPASYQPSAEAAKPSSASNSKPTPPPRATSRANDTARRDPFFDAQRFSYAPDFYEAEIQDFLDQQPGPLKDTRFQIGDQSHSFAEVLVNLSSLYSFNPTILLALMEQQSEILSQAEPSPEQIAWAMGFHGDEERRKGLYAQLYWGAVELRHALRDYAVALPDATLPDLVFADDSQQAAAPDMGLARYAIARVLAHTTTPDQLPARLDAFLRTYTDLFGDPRLPLTDLPPPAEPFLTRPMTQPARVTSFFDHDTPFLQQNGSLRSFWGTTEAILPYDGHTGWDYAMKPPDPVLAAADGLVVFAGNSDDGCALPARAVIVDHANGYRTLYWHLDTLDVTTGQRVAQGEQLGTAGATGCAFGPHLHFQVQYLGRDIDPYGWCSTERDPWATNPAGQISTWLWADMLNPCKPPPSDIIVVDDTSPNFFTSGSWQQSSLGYGGNALYNTTSQNNRNRQPWQMRVLVDTPAVAIWQPTLPHAGRYRVLVYVPFIWTGIDDSRELRYRIVHSEAETEVIVNAETVANYWADLGTYTFDPAQKPRVSLSTLAGDDARGLWADAVAWVPVEATP